MNDSYENLMQEQDMDESPGDRYWWSPASVLTTGASAITAFTLAVAGLMGFVGFPVAEAVVGFPDGPDAMRDRAIVSAMVVLLFLIGTFWLSQRVLVADDEQEPAWPRHLAGSAVVIATIGTILSVVTIVGALLADSTTFPRMGP